MKLRIFSFLLSLIASAYGERESLVSEEVYRRLDGSIKEYHQTPAKWSESKTKALREMAFAGLDDREKIRAIAEWIFRQKPPLHHNLVSLASGLLRAPEPMIEDYSELRRLMATESDSRRFFQLSTLAYRAEGAGYDFMADRARGLFMEGIAADRGQSTTGHPLHSISMNTFSRITERLRDESQVFKDEVYPELVKLDLEARNLALAKWLKANWAGCEALEIPEKEKREPRQIEDSAREPREAKDWTSGEPDKVAEPSSPARPSPWLWISAAVVLLAAFIGFFRLRKS